VLDLGAHHLDLMFSDPRNPPCFAAAREVEARMIRQWCQEAYDNLGLL
jgi:lysosomal Pro-X carboxypeptidase